MICDDISLQPAIDEIKTDQHPVILVVDDDRQQTEALAYALNRQGYRTLTAATAADAMQMAEQEVPQLIILDIRLPDGDGLSVCRQLSDDSRTQHIPVMLVSALDRSDIVRQARAAGGQYYLRKPYDPNALLVLAESAIAGGWGW